MSRSLLFAVAAVGVAALSLNQVVRPTTLPDYLVEEAEQDAHNVEDHDFKCCAMWRDGSYYSNISVSGTLADELAGGRREAGGRILGYMAADAERERFAISIGCNDIRNSPAGFYSSKCVKENKESQAFGVAWDPSGCSVFKLPRVPKVCFGKDSYVPLFHSRVQLDYLTKLLKFRNEDNNVFQTINPVTCMPFWSSHYYSMSDHANVADPMAAVDGRRLRAAVGKGEEVLTHMLVLHENATATAPNHDTFGFPTRCAYQAYSIEHCDL